MIPQTIQYSYMQKTLYERTALTTFATRYTQIVHLEDITLPVNSRDSPITPSLNYRKFFTLEN